MIDDIISNLSTPELLELIKLISDEIKLRMMQEA